MAHRYIIANWKMNNNPSEASALVHHLDAKVKADDNVSVVLCPPFIDLYPLAREVDQAKFSLGAQNIHYEDQGAFTGEISPAMLKGLVAYTILGHSDRRIKFGEDDKLIAKKVPAALRHGIRPVLCVGEDLMDHEHGAGREVVTSQLTADLSLVSAGDMAKVIITYEPVWAISTNGGKPDTPDQVAPMVKLIRQTIGGLYGPEPAAAVPVLYGGSVNPHDVRAFLDVDGIDGVLVGAASLNYEDFSKIIMTAQKLS